MEDLGFEESVPWIVGECAATCLAVISDPLHKLYGKVCRFLQKYPSWEVEKIPSYWIDKILLHEPDLDDGYSEEINWLLDMLVRGLRTRAVSSSFFFFLFLSLSLSLFLFHHRSAHD